jgi:hypothetical protein
VCAQTACLFVNRVNSYVSLPAWNQFLMMQVPN